MWSDLRREATSSRYTNRRRTLCGILAMTHADPRQRESRGSRASKAMLSMQFDAITNGERMDRAFKIRNAVYNNESVCGMPLTTNRVLTSKSLR